MKKRFCTLFFIPIVILALFSGCTSFRTDQLPPHTNLTPSETVQTAFDCLKSADTTGFNQYAYYPSHTENGVLHAYNIMFGNDLEGEERELVESIVADLTYEVGDAHEIDNGATVAVTICNRDLSSINILSYAEYDNALIEAIKSANNGMVSNVLTVSLTKSDGYWKIVIDEELMRALCGGLSISIFDDILGLISENLP